MVCVCVCVLDSMNLFVSSDLSLKSFSNCLDPRLEIDSEWRCQTSHEFQAISAALVTPLFFHQTFTQLKEFYTKLPLATKSTIEFFFSFYQTWFTCCFMYFVVFP